MTKTFPFNFAAIPDRQSVTVRAFVVGEATYLHNEAVYHATREGQYIHFRNVVTGSGTSERIPMLRVFAVSGAVRCELISEAR